MAGGFAEGADWIQEYPTTAYVDSGDYDGDGIKEYKIANDQLCAIIDKRGGRILWLFTRDGDCIVGNHIGNWGAEDERDTGGHPGLLSDSQAENSWFDVVVNIPSGDRAILSLVERYDYEDNPSNDLYKTITLDYGKKYLKIIYSSQWSNWSKAGISPGMWDLALYGYALMPVSGISDNGWMYGGYRNFRTGATGAYLWGAGRGLTFHYISRLATGAELMELGGISGNYSIYFYAGREDPEIDVGGPGDMEGPMFYELSQQPPHSILPEDTVQVSVRVTDPSGVDSVGVVYSTNDWYTSNTVNLLLDDGDWLDWNGNGEPDSNLWGGYIPPMPEDTRVEYYFYGYDGIGNVGYESNYGENYSYTVGQIYFVMNGSLDRVAQILDWNGGMHLWYYWYPDQWRLYLATEAAGSDEFSNDHFIFVADFPGPMKPSPWNKAGEVGQWLAFMADENDVHYFGWFDSSATRIDTLNVHSGRAEDSVLEGSINLHDYFTELPDVIYVCAASYQTSDGGELQWQVPGDGAPIDLDIDPGDYYPIVLGTTGIDQPPEKEKITTNNVRVFPNPFTSRLSFTFAKPFTGVLDLYDITGRKIFSTCLDSRTEYILNSRNRLPIGVYFYKIRGEQTLKGKLIKVR